MADDTDILGDEQAPEAGSQEPTQDPTAKVQDQTQGMSVQEQEQRLVQIFGPTLGSLGERLSGIEAALAKGEDGNGEAETTPAGGESELDAFLANPNATIESIAKKVADQAADGVKTPDAMVKSVAGFHLMGEKQKVDAEYGEGTFVKEIAPLLRNPLAQLSNEQKVDPEILHTIVTAALGQDMVRQKLHASRDKMVKLRADPPKLMGGGASPSITQSDKLTSEESELCDKVGMDTKTYLEMRKSEVMDIDAFDSMQSRMSSNKKSNAQGAN